MATSRSTDYCCLRSIRSCVPCRAGGALPLHLVQFHARGEYLMGCASQGGFWTLESANSLSSERVRSPIETQAKRSICSQHQNAALADASDAGACSVAHPNNDPAAATQYRLALIPQSSCDGQRIPWPISCSSESKGNQIPHSSLVQFLFLVQGTNNFYFRGTFKYPMFGCEIAAATTQFIRHYYVVRQSFFARATNFEDGGRE
mmetsp:Transcript_8686/g.26959  ORF Transcript_8686/g.26959 Transcript_8686/m.26959 type:complete len:204 (-) Transcript_8686:11-622(-)